MTDRELLKLAANAANLKWVDDREHGITVQAVSDGGPYNYVWNPLLDDGDALRLAVKLVIQIDWAHKHDGSDNQAWANFGSVVVSFYNDPYAATRRAIVRAAAEIGKGMK
jgi:hypothetical protein